MKKLLSVLFLFSVFICSAQWNEDVSENLNISGEIGDHSAAQTVKTTDGKTWIAFYKKSQFTANYDMWVQLLDVNGKKILSDTGLLVSNLPSGGNTFVHHVCIDGNNNLIIGFSYSIKYNSRSVIYKIDQTGNSLWGKRGITLGSGFSPWPATLSNGETIVVWADDNDSLKMQKITKAGKAAWDAPLPITFGTGRFSKAYPLANLKGAFTLLIEQKTVVPPYILLYAMRYSANGTALWQQSVLLNSTTTQPFFTFSPLADKDTSYLGYTYTGATQVAFLQRINPDGKLPYGINGSHFALDTANRQQNNMYICTNSNLPYIWGVCEYSDINQDRYAIKIQKFRKKDGKRLLGNNALPVTALSYLRQKTVSPVSIKGKGGLIFTSYDSSLRLKAYSFNALGLPVWKPRLLSSTINPPLQVTKYFQTFDYNNNQGVAVWVEQRNSGYQVYAQNIKDNGTTGSSMVADYSTADSAAVVKIDLPANGLSVFPNPVKDVLNIRITSQNNYEGYIAITGASGHVLFMRRIMVSKNGTLQSFDVSGFSQGIYFIKLTSADGTININSSFIKG